METKTQHTPGPWKFELGTKTIRSIPENYWLATMDSWDGAVDHGANATLIAAAPDLLAACKDAMAALQYHGHYGDCIALEAAIAKAEGRDQ